VVHFQAVHSAQRWCTLTAQRQLYAEQQYLADMLPVNSTFTGHLATAEAIYDGGAGNLVGVKTFSGEKGNQSPQHAVLLGMSGAGKSVTVCDLLTQTEAYYDYTVIIEEGFHMASTPKQLSRMPSRSFCNRTERSRSTTSIPQGSP